MKRVSGSFRIDQESNVTWDALPVQMHHQSQNQTLMAL